MRRHELTTLTAHLNGLLKLGFEGEPPVPIINIQIQSDLVIFQTGDTNTKPLTLEALRQALSGSSATLLVADHNRRRIYGFRQNDGWLLFK